jgi:hypothetical protein
MSVYYFNGAQILAPLTIESNEPIFDVDTVSLSKQRASQGAQRWELSFDTAMTNTTEADMLVGMVTGIATSGTMVMPQLPSVDLANTASATLSVSVNAAAESSTVTVVSDGVISKGSFVKFSNHDKLYMVTADVAAGTAPVSIYPSLRSAVSTSHTLKTGPSVILTYYRNVDNLRGIQFTDGVLSSVGVVSLVEAIT